MWHNHFTLTYVDYLDLYALYNLLLFNIIIIIIITYGFQAFTKHCSSLIHTQNAANRKRARDTKLMTQNKKLKKHTDSQLLEAKKRELLQNLARVETETPPQVFTSTPESTVLTSTAESTAATPTSATATSAAATATATSKREKSFNLTT